MLEKCLRFSANSYNLNENACHIPLICKHHKRETLQFIIVLVALAMQCNEVDNIFRKYVPIVLLRNVASHIGDVDNGNL